jgi:putative mRNA 3-end processing factor
VLRLRVRGASDDVSIQGIKYGEAIEIGSVRVSLHPAGHVLGSAQVRVESKTGTWVVSGDYKTIADRTCEPFEPVKCEVFITESTFGLPIYKWRPQSEVFDEINAWWRNNAAIGRTSIVFAYALGKAQRVLAGVDASIGPIAVHGSLLSMNEAYRREGIALPPMEHAAGDAIDRVRGRGLVVAPPSALGSPWVRKFAASEGGMSAAFVSGWMQVRGTRRRRAIDRGFVLSDHADWEGLLWAIRETGAARVGVTHGYVGPLVRWLKESGLESFAVPTRYTGEIGEAAEEAGAKGEQNAEAGNEDAGGAA